MKPSKIILNNPSLYQFTQSGLELVDKIFEDERIESIEDAAYILATVRHETAGSYKPISEYGKGKGKPYGLIDSITGQIYYGRGYVQLTWKENYEKFQSLFHKDISNWRFKFDLINNPDQVMNIELAYEIMIIGMTKGLFTGKKLSDYINDEKVDYFNARKIINGTDKACNIQVYAWEIEKTLKIAFEDSFQK